jgi:Dirigent-like protein
MFNTKALAAVVLAALISALLVASPATGSINKPQVFSLLELEGPETALDPGGGENEPPKAGARFAFTSTLHEWAGQKRGQRVGWLEGLCTYTTVDVAMQAASVYCTASWHLPAGQLLGAGFIRFAANSGPTFRIAVVGGTGAYSNARGYIKITSLGGDESGKSKHQFHLMP